MKVNLNQLDLVRLVLPLWPESYKAMDKYINRKLGRYIGGFSDRWEWDRSALMKLSEEQLVDLYFEITGRDIRVKE